MHDYIKSLPPTSLNNSRHIVRSKFERFNKSKSEFRANELERITGLEADFRDSDFVCEPRKKVKGEDLDFEIENALAINEINNG